MRGILVNLILLIFLGVTALLIWLQEKRRTDRISGTLDSYYSRLKERRQTIRLNKQLNIVCKVAEKAGSHWSVFSKDISGEGICVYLPEILPQDAIVDLDINIPGKGLVSVRGEVVWVKEDDTLTEGGRRLFSAGIRFIKIKPKDKNNLVNFIEASLNIT